MYSHWKNGYVLFLYWLFWIYNITYLLRSLRTKFALFFFSSFFTSQSQYKYLFVFLHCLQCYTNLLESFPFPSPTFHYISTFNLVQCDLAFNFPLSLRVYVLLQQITVGEQSLLISSLFADSSWSSSFSNKEFANQCRCWLAMTS